MPSTCRARANTQAALPACVVWHLQTTNCFIGAKEHHNTEICNNKRRRWRRRSLEHPHPWHQPCTCESVNGCRLSPYSTSSLFVVKVIYCNNRTDAAVTGHVSEGSTSTCRSTSRPEAQVKRKPVPYVLRLLHTRYNCCVPQVYLEESPCFFRRPSPRSSPLSQNPSHPDHHHNAAYANQCLAPRTSFHLLYQASQPL